LETGAALTYYVAKLFSIIIEQHGEACCIVLIYQHLHAEHDFSTAVQFVAELG
jgi:hypothetical protein